MDRTGQDRIGHHRPNARIRYGDDEMLDERVRCQSREREYVADLVSLVKDFQSKNKKRYRLLLFSRVADVRTRGALFTSRV